MLTLTENIWPLLLLTQRTPLLGPNSRQVVLLLTFSLEPVKHKDMFLNEV